VIWREFEVAAPELAQLGRERFERTRVALLATLRNDGSPRISPIGPYLVLGHLLLGVMRSKKTHDLLRDARCALHSSISDLNGSEGEFKLYGRAVEIHDPAIRDGDYDAWWRGRPLGTSLVFSMDIESAAFVAWDIDKGELAMQQWSAEHGTTQTRRPYP
jgi:pyridoxamine 5'-phosphate oxidase-like protein